MKELPKELTAELLSLLIGSEVETVIKATHWVATEKGLLNKDKL